MNSYSFGAISKFLDGPIHIKGAMNPRAFAATQRARLQWHFDQMLCDAFGAAVPMISGATKEMTYR